MRTVTLEQLKGIAERLKPTHRVLVEPNVCTLSCRLFFIPINRDWSQCEAVLLGMPGLKKLDKVALLFFRNFLNPSLQNQTIWGKLESELSRITAVQCPVSKDRFMAATCRSIDAVYQGREALPEWAFDLFLSCPQAIGVSLAALLQCQAAAVRIQYAFPKSKFLSFELAYLVIVMGKNWLAYLRQFVDTTEAEIAYAILAGHHPAGVPPGIDIHDLLGLIHSAYVNMALTKHLKLRSLREYIRRHSLLTPATIRYLSEQWDGVTPSRLKMPPQDLVDWLQTKNARALARAGLVAPPEIAHYLQSADQCNQVVRLLRKGAKVPLPSWAQAQMTENDYTVRVLPRCDLRGLFLGHYTDCCHTLRLMPFVCTHGQTSPHGAFLVIEKNQKILGCAWVWQGRDGRVCLDNVEVRRGFRKSSLIRRLLVGWAKKTGQRVTVGARYSDISLRNLPSITASWPVDFPEDISKTGTDAENQVILYAPTILEADSANA